MRAAMPDTDVLLKVARMRMPFGRYRGRLLIDLPEPYMVWFARQGFPPTELGRLLALVHEVKVNGLEYLFDKLRDAPESEGPDKAT